MNIRSDELRVRKRQEVEEAAVMAFLVNKGNGRSPFVETTVRFYNRADEVLDELSTGVLGLAPNEVWESYLPYLGDPELVDRYELRGTFAAYHPPPNPEQMRLGGHELGHRDSGPVVTGQATNSGPDRLTNPEAWAKFYAENGNLLETGTANAITLHSGETWSFVIPFASFDPTARTRVASHTALVTDKALSLDLGGGSTSDCGAIGGDLPSNC